MNQCRVGICDKPIKGRELCVQHLVIDRNGGNPDDHVIGSRGQKGTGTVTSKGYRRLTDPRPDAPSKYILEHRLVMEIELGRFLDKYENVHHINGDRLDNRIENLEIWSTRQPQGQRIEDKLRYAMELLIEYSEEYPEYVEQIRELT